MNKIKKFIVCSTLAAGLGMSAGQSLAADDALCQIEDGKVDMKTWVGLKIYDRAFGRGCATCHDVSPNPNLLESVKKLSQDEFGTILKNGKNAMPKAVDAILEVGPAKKAGYDEAEAIEAVYNYLKCRSDGTIPAGKLKKMK
ncbi:MAG: cytochrome c [Methylococcales bacterium]